MSSFGIGVLIVGVGTSLPELATSIAAALEGATEIVIANVVGSNITNILLIIGLLAASAGPLGIDKKLIKTELPVFFISTVLFIAVIFDGRIDRFEGILLIATFCAYIWHLYTESKKAHKDLVKVSLKENSGIKTFLLVACSLAGVLLGAHFTVEMTVNIATTFHVPIGLISIVAIAIGTSLPELFVTFHAYKMGKTDLAIGSIYGSNAFNILLVIGIPALITPLIAEPLIMKLGLPILIGASLLFFANGFFGRIRRWEGVMMLLFFIFFLVKLTDYL